MIFWLFQFYIRHFPFPHRGLKYFLRLLRLLKIDRRIFEKKLPQGFRMWLTPFEHQQLQLLWYGRYDAHITRYLEKSLKAGDTFLDIGANIGYYSLVAGTISPAIRVIAIEPVRSNFEKLKMHLERNRIEQANAYHFAVGSAPGNVTMFHAGPENEGMSALHPPENYVGTQEQVEMIVLDSWEVTNALKRIDLIKIDTEGNEIEVLRGMKELIKKHRPRIILECNPETLARFGETPATLLKECETIGYSVIDLTSEKNEFLTNASPPNFAVDLLLLPLNLENVRNS